MHTEVKVKYLTFTSLLHENLKSSLSDNYFSVAKMGNTLHILFCVEPESSELALMNSIVDSIDFDLSVIFEKKNEMKDCIDCKRVELYFTDFEYNSHIFHGELEDLESLKEAILTASVHESFAANWKTKTGIIFMEKSDFLSVNLILASKKNDLWQASFIHKAAIEAMTNMDDLEAYDVDANWIAV